MATRTFFELLKITYEYELQKVGVYVLEIFIMEYFLKDINNYYQMIYVPKDSYVIVVFSKLATSEAINVTIFNFKKLVLQT